jgi:hypothetical protein
MGFEAIIGLLLSKILAKSAISFADAELLQKLIGGITDLFARSKRTCVHKTHECTFRDGSCHVLLDKGEKWQIEDIEACAYRKKIE